MYYFMNVLNECLIPNEFAIYYPSMMSIHNSQHHHICSVLTNITVPDLETLMH